MISLLGGIGFFLMMAALGLTDSGWSFASGVALVIGFSLFSVAVVATVKE